MGSGTAKEGGDGGSGRGCATEDVGDWEATLGAAGMCAREATLWDARRSGWPVVRERPWGGKKGSALGGDEKTVRERERGEGR